MMQPNNPNSLPQNQQDFLNRFQQQGPAGLSPQEAQAQYQQVAPQLPPQVFQQSAQDVFAHMTPEQRMQLGQQLVQSARQQGMNFPDVNGDGIDDRLQDPEYLARTTTRVQQEQPGLLGGLLGGLAGGRPSGGMGQAPMSGSGGMLSSPVAKGVMGGIAAYGLSRMLGGGGHHYGGGFFGGAPMMMGGMGGGFFGGGMGDEMYEEGYEEAVEDMGGGDFGDFGE